MGTIDDARFWDRTARRYAQAAMADPVGHQRTVDRTRVLLGPNASVLELGCGTGTMAVRLARDVRSYLATDISTAMIAIARERHASHPDEALSFHIATVETLAPEARPFDVVLGFNYLHLVRELPATLRRIHALLAPDGLFISKTPCIGDMNPFIRLALLPMRAIGKAPYAAILRAKELSRLISAAGFDILATEFHAAGGGEASPYIVAHRQ